MRQSTGRVLARGVGSLLLGLVIALIGTGVHRALRPWGLVLALLLVLLGAVVVRAWARGTGMLALAVGVAAGTLVLGASGPGSDVLIAADVWGYVWYPAALLVPLALLLPRAWFRDLPEPTSVAAGAPVDEP